MCKALRKVQRAALTQTGFIVIIYYLHSKSNRNDSTLSACLPCTQRCFKSCGAICHDILRVLL